MPPASSGSGVARRRNKSHRRARGARARAFAATRRATAAAVAQGRKPAKAGTEGGATPARLRAALAALPAPASSARPAAQRGRAAVEREGAHCSCETLRETQVEVCEATEPPDDASTGEVFRQVVCPAAFPERVTVNHRLRDVFGVSVGLDVSFTRARPVEVRHRGVAAAAETHSPGPSPL
eukprot:scaffold6871_cov75-Phaeocystis_antarctica.AAC.3